VIGLLGNGGFGIGEALAQRWSAVGRLGHPMRR